MSVEPVRWREIFETVEESGLSDLVLLASQICGAPIALITLVEDAGQWFKAQIGISIAGDWETSFCAHAVRQSDIFVVPDAMTDARFSDHPHVRGAPHVRFYAGTPLVAADASTIGTLCVMDTIARQLTGSQVIALRVLAAQVVGQLELRRYVLELKRTESALKQREEELRESQRELERVAALRRELVANVSHDLRTPLALLQGHLDTLLLKQTEFSADEQRRYLEVAARQGERLGTLIAELFELARLESGVMQLRLEPFSVNDLVQDAVQDRQLTAAERKIRLEHQSSTGVPLVIADIALIARVLENLLDNAMRHTPDDGVVRITVGMRGDRIVVSVSNTGSWISNDELPLVFDRFRRFDRDTVDASQGAGLGLAIAQKIVMLHGGAIEVESRPGEGTTFRLSLATQPT